jgi:hypothetical protein
MTRNSPTWSLRWSISTQEPKGVKKKSTAWLLLVLGLFAAGEGRLHAGDCKQTEGFYVDQHYVVKSIKLEAPLDIFHFVDRSVQLDQLPLKAQKLDSGTVIEKGEFDNVAFAMSGRSIRDEISAKMGPNFRVQFVLVLPELRSCDDASHTLEAVFRVFGFSIPTALARPVDLQSGPSLQQSSSSHQGGLLQSLAPQVTAGYDTNRHLFAGGRSTYQGAPGGLFDTLTLEGAGSSTSTLFHGSLKGSRNWKHGPVQRAQWAASYILSDLPSTAFQLNENTVNAWFSANSPPLFNQALVLYFGTALNAGNQHSSGSSTIPSNISLQSQVGNLKGYLGSAWSLGPNILKASYGIQAGKSTPGVHVDYWKQIVHAADSLRLLPKDHRPLTLDLQFGAGWITGAGPVPLPETFFGGNLNREFIPGDPWRIPIDPFIRSFPTNSQNLTAQGGVGGNNFFSVNATIAYALWGKPLVPQSILPQVEPTLNGQMNTFELALTHTYVADLPEFKALTADLLTHRPEIAELRQKLVAQGEAGVSDEISGQVNDTLDDLSDVEDSFEALGTRTAEADPIGPALLLLVGSPQVPQLTTVADDLKDLVDLLTAAGKTTEAADFRSRETALRNFQASFLARFNAIKQDGATARAKSDMKFPRSVVGELLHALNIYSIAPALMLDASRIGPQQGPAQPGTRYGVGPAVRLSLLNVELTLGYSVNPNRQPGERRGAPVVTFEISDIFR